jgi:hypothetical protein
VNPNEMLRYPDRAPERAGSRHARQSCPPGAPSAGRKATCATLDTRRETLGESHTLLRLLTKCPCAAGVSIFQPQATMRRACRKQTSRGPRDPRILGIPPIVRAVPRGTATGSVLDNELSTRTGGWRAAAGALWQASSSGAGTREKPRRHRSFTPGSPPFMHPAKLLLISYLANSSPKEQMMKRMLRSAPPAARTSSVPRGTD